MRSRLKNIMNRVIFINQNIVDPPKQPTRHPVLSPALEKALSEIEQGAEEWLEAMRAEKQKLETGGAKTETVPRLIGHIEKVEEDEDDVPEQEQMAVKHKEVEDDTTTEEENLPTRPCKRKTPLVTKAKQAALEAKIRQQKRRYDEANKMEKSDQRSIG